MDKQRQTRIFKKLAHLDSVLLPLVKQYSPLDFYQKNPSPPFHTLVSMVINQQLSQKAAATIQSRVLSAQGGRHFSARKLVLLSDLRQFGVSRPKQSYIHSLVEGVLSGDLNFRRLKSQPNSDVRLHLMTYPGIGAWTADVFLLANFHREDVFPAGDLILQKVIQKLYSLPTTYKTVDYAKYAERWQPHRSLVSLLFWKAANTEP